MTKLRESHERALMSSLSVMEDNLQRIRALLKEGNPTEQTITYHRVDNIDPKSKPRIINVITDMLNEIKQMKELFQLETEEINLGAEISAALNEIWIILVDLNPESLEAYGELEESDKALIEPHALSLLNKLDKIRQLIQL
jgi:hypothetical protein